MTVIITNVFTNIYTNITFAIIASTNPVITGPAVWTNNFLPLFSDTQMNMVSNMTSEELMRRKYHEDVEAARKILADIRKEREFIEALRKEQK